MKKILFAVFFALAGVVMTSCEPKSTTPPPPPPTPVGTTVLSEAVYHGEELGEKVGYYSMTFTNGDDKLRLDLFASVAPDPDKAKILGGTYDLGTLEEPVTKTYFVAENGTDEVGTLFWSNGTPVLVTGGEVTVQVAAGGYAINVALTAGDQKIEWKYSGTITFINKYKPAPRLPITAELCRFIYTGEYALSQDPLGVVAVILTTKANADKGALQFYMTIPIPEDLNNIQMPTGTFEVVKDPQEPYKILAGYVESSRFNYSYEYEIVNGLPTKMTLITAGTATFSEEGGKFSLATNFTGSIANVASGNIVGIQEGVIYNLYLDETPFIDDDTRPQSTLEEDLTLDPNKFVNLYVDEPWAANESKSLMLWRIIFYTDGLEIKRASDYDTAGSLEIYGEGGELISLQIMTSGDVKSPAGTYPMSDLYAALQGGARLNTAVPGYPQMDDIVGLGVGTWYGKTDMVDGVHQAVGSAGAVPSEGSVKITLSEDNTLSAEIEVFDRYHHTISGTLSAPVVAEPATESLNQLPLQLRVAPVGGFIQYSLPFAL